jgi:uncharacterized flavoprotein (TIGR03862 family)
LSHAEKSILSTACVQLFHRPDAMSSCTRALTQGTGTVTSSLHEEIAVIGGGPAGLMAADVLAAAGCTVTVYDRMPTFGRKFLLAGRGGLNLTHSEPREDFLLRYGAACDWLRPQLDAFPPGALAGWCEDLGISTFVGSSGRVFPGSFKASPLLRAWLRKLDAPNSGGGSVRFAARHRWIGWDDTAALLLETADGGRVSVTPRATVLALGGASWPKLGADGGWVTPLREAGVTVRDLSPANSGCEIAWTSIFKERFAGQPLKRVAVTAGHERVLGEAIVTQRGLEGGAIYAVSSHVRDALAAGKACSLTLDLRPDVSQDRLIYRFQTPRGKQSMSNYLRKAAGLSPVAIGLLREGPLGQTLPGAPEGLASRIKALPLSVNGVGDLSRAISTAGGIALPDLDDNLMLRARPGVFAAGEMLNWEAPTGGYLLQACLSTGRAAAHGVLAWLDRPIPDVPLPAWSIQATSGTPAVPEADQP